MRTTARTTLPCVCYTHRSPVAAWQYQSPPHWPSTWNYGSRWWTRVHRNLTPGSTTLHKYDDTWHMMIHDICHSETYVVHAALWLAIKRLLTGQHKFSETQSKKNPLIRIVIVKVTGIGINRYRHNRQDCPKVRHHRIYSHHHIRASWNDRP